MRTLFTFLILWLPLTVLGQSPTRTIKGEIRDLNDGTPLIGATVFIAPSETQAKDYNPQGTVADNQGRFLLTLPSNVSKVIVSYIGYEDQTIDITDKSDFTIRLKPSVNEMDEVVVTGYQKIEKRKLTSSIAQIKMDDIKQTGAASVDQMLQGQLAGVLAVPTNGAPGAASKIRVRSTATLNGNEDPLWVLDGMPLEGNDIPKDYDSKENLENLRTMSIAGLNPDDIEDITVLKDAAATAIYGARAANGVIIITTKNGRRNTGPTINVSAATFITARPNMDKLNLMNASQKVDFELGLAANPRLTYLSAQGAVSRILRQYNQLDALRTGGLDAISAEAREAIDKLRTAGTDWAKEIYRPTINQQYSLSVSGGGNKAGYYFSAGYFNEQGTTKKTGFNRFNLTLKTDFDIHRKVKAGVAMFATQSVNSSYLSDADSFTNPNNYLRTVNPYLEAYDAMGNYIYDPDMMYQQRSDQPLDFNVLEEMNNTRYELKKRMLNSIFDITYRPADWLKFTTQLGLQVENSATEKFADKSTYFVRKYALDSETQGKIWLPDGGIIQNDHNDMSQYNWKAQGEFNKAFNRVHEIDVMLGLEMRGNTSSNIHTKGFGFDPKTLTTKPIYFPDGSSKATESRFRQYINSFSENRYLSYFATASYTYDNRYTFYGSMRYDGSNLFGVDPKYKFTPLWSASGAWSIHREKWLQDVNWLSNLKLRLSYGLQGNVDRNTSPYIIGSWGNTTVLPGGTNEPSINVTSPPNQNLRWETTATWNVGLDVGVFDDRLNLVAEAYHRVSDNLIGVQAIPTENGFNYTMTNYGKITNKGFEISLASVNILTPDFRWETNFNIAHNKGIVNRIDIRENEFFPSKVGYSPNAVFGVKTAGLDEEGMPLFWKGDKIVPFEEFFNVTVEDIWGMKFTSTDYSPAAVRERLTYMGDADPKFLGGMTNRFFYKNFDLTIGLSFILNQTVTRQPFYTPSRTNPGQNYTTDVFDIWSPSNPNGIYPMIPGAWDDIFSDPDRQGLLYTVFEDDPIGLYNYFDTWIKKISYVRVNTIRLGYSLPDAALRKLRVAALRIHFEARNPFVFGSSHKGYFDPETYGNIYMQPIPRTFSVGVNLTF